VIASSTTACSCEVEVSSQYRKQKMTIETPWHNNFPQPKSKPQSLSNTEVVNSLLNDPSKIPGKDYVIVDVRRTDFEVYS
jgi:hypothetical protein